MERDQLKVGLCSAQSEQLHQCYNPSHSFTVHSHQHWLHSFGNGELTHPQRSTLQKDSTYWKCNLPLLSSKLPPVIAIVWFQPKLGKYIESLSSLFHKIGLQRCEVHASWSCGLGPVRIFSARLSIFEWLHDSSQTLTGIASFNNLHWLTWSVPLKKDTHCQCSSDSSEVARGNPRPLSNSLPNSPTQHFTNSPTCWEWDSKDRMWGSQSLWLTKMSGRCWGTES